MKILKGISVILLHLLLGNALSFLIDGFLPGSVLGMMLMFISLAVGLVKEETVHEVATFLTSNLSLFFIPALVGALGVWGVIKLHFWEWFFISVVTVVIVMAAAGWTKQLTDKVRRKK